MIINIEESYKPIIWLNRFLGLSVHPFSKTQPGNKLNIVCSIVKLLVCFISTVIYLLITYKAYLLFNLLKTFVFFNATIYVISMVEEFFMKRNLDEFFKAIIWADETLKIFGITMDYQIDFFENKRILFIWIFCVLIILFSTFLGVGVTYYGIYDLYKVWLSQFFFLFPCLFNSTKELNFVAQMSYIKKRFDRMNYLIKHLLRSPLRLFMIDNLNEFPKIIKIKNDNISTLNHEYINRKNITSVLKIFRQVHLNLCRLSQETNKSYHLYFLMRTITFFFEITVLSYHLYYSLYKYRYIYCVSIGLQILLTFIEVLVIIHAAMNVAAEAQKTSRAVHEIQLSLSRPQLLNEIEQFSVQVEQHRLNLSACDLIPLDYNYVIKIIAFITTYLVVMIQSSSDFV